MENIEIEVQIGESTFTSSFQNDMPYRNIALEDLTRLKMEAVETARFLYDYIDKMPEGREYGIAP